MINKGRWYITFFATTILSVILLYDLDTNNSPLVKNRGMLLLLILMTFIVVRFVLLLLPGGEKRHDKALKSTNSHVSSRGNYNELASSNYYRIINESVQIIKTTVKPNIFFSRYLLMQENLTRLAVMINPTPDNQMQILDFADDIMLNRQLYTNQFFYRYFEKLTEDVGTLKTEHGKAGRVAKAFDMIEKYVYVYSPEIVPLLETHEATFHLNSSALLNALRQEIDN